MKTTTKILILEDNKEDVDAIIRALKNDGFAVPIEHCDNRECFNLKLDEFKPDIIIAEHTIPGYNSFMALDDARKKLPDIIFILMTRTIPEEFAIELIKEGMEDYVLKDHFIHLPHVIKTAYEKRKYVEQTRELKKANQELEEANAIIDAKNQAMTQSIVFAERIQNLLLPKIEILLEEFKEAFILFKPKDIVSGDFYWFNKKGNEFMVTAADCTGHGVPGALLSIIGINFLNEIAEDPNGFTHPADILSLLDLNMASLLKQDANSGYQDGIDIAFATIDKKHKKLYFSGCKRPLLIYRRRSKQMTEYKGNKYYIGGVDSRVTKTFATHEIPYQAGDVIYMFSDGVVDLFGGPEDKKLMKKNLIDMLMSFQHLSLTYQGELLEQKLKKWQGEHTQIDDIIIIGIKL